jgi:hypothetical protein
VLDLSSSAAADSWYNTFSTVSIVGAVVGVFATLAVAIATVGLSKAGAAKEMFANERLSENEKETKRAIAASDIAKAELATARANIAAANERVALAEERILSERRLTAKERMRLERIERIVLPRTIDSSVAPVLVQALKDAKLKPICLAVLLDDQEAALYGFAFSRVLQAAGLLAARVDLPAGSNASSLIVIGADEDADKLADLLFQKFQIGQGSRERVPKGLDPSKVDRDLAGLPTDQTCLVIGSNRTAAVQGIPGQPGEGIDEHGGSVPEPQ